MSTIAATHQVLIVEDDPDLREAVRHALEGEGCRVRTVGNGAEAMTLLHEGNCPCLILLDLMMPVMNGWQFLEQRKGEGKLLQIPVVVMSAYLDLPGFAAPHLPVEGTLKKPIDLDHLLEVIDRLCTCQSG